ncbi:DUF2059 domain-containing protein [Kiloniella sp.]|uniref:DUF2059 domain-containing protein n=1 Tax=Kiloniella sp. TaxID=1938587 RepID=UPI003A8FE2FA
MEKLILLTMLIIGITSPSFAQDTQETRIEAANRYADTVDLSKMMNDLSIETSKALPAEIREQFLTKTHFSEADINEIREMMLEQMIIHFTTKELDALAKFYGSPEGKSIIVKMPVYFGGVYPKMQKFILKKYAQ